MIENTTYSVMPLDMLLPYQHEGVNYALAKRNCIIADEMGLGKTIQAIALLSILLAEQLRREVPTDFYCVIVCPLSLKINWSRELDKWLGDAWWLKYSIQIIAYTELPKYAPSKRIDLLIVDEAQYIKNQNAARSQHVRRIGSYAARIVLLTGTPIENRVQELWSLLTLVAPDYWCPPIARIVPRQLPISVVLTSSRKPEEKKKRNERHWQFMKRYCGPVRKEVFIKGKKGKQVVYEFTGGSNLDELNRRLRESCMIRRLKKDVLPQLPPKRHEIVTFPCYTLEEHEELLFSQVSELGSITIDNYDTVVHKLHTTKIAFTAWSRYRHAQGVDKIPLIVEHVKDCLEKVEKIVIFAHHRDVILGLLEAFVFTGVVHLTGEQDITERDAAVQAFQNDPRIRIFVGSIRAAGVGLTLTAANMVLFAEIDPNPGIMNQAIDRAHRIGLKDSLLVQYAVSDGSIDARLCKILVQKQSIAEKALGVSNYGVP